MSWKHDSVQRFIKENNSIGDNPIDIIKQKAKDLTLAAISDGWDGPPYNIIDFARINNINTTPNMHVTEARISYNDEGIYTIEYNPYQNSKRINFSIAHEIGHTFFSDCHEIVRNREIREYDFEDNAWELEFLCNVAAAELLLPYSSIFHDANSIELDYNGLVLLSDKYQVSLEALLTRIPQVVEKPCATAIAYYDIEDSNSLKIQYSNVSLSSSWEIPTKYKIPDDSGSYECLRSGWSNFKLENWEAIDKSLINVYSIGLSPLKGETMPRVGLLITPESQQDNEAYLKKVVGDASNPKGEGLRIIAQVVNTAGGLGAGFGKAMATRYPAIRKVINEWKKDKDSFRLGETKIVELGKDIYVFFMIAQKGIKQNLGQSSLDYSSLRSCLGDLANAAKSVDASIHMPLIGAGQAKGNWDVIENIIYDQLIKTGVDVTIYILPGTPAQNSNVNSPTLFD